MRHYFLRSARLGFSTWSAQDLPLAQDLWGDAQVTRLTGGPFTQAQVAERLARELMHQERHQIQYWPIFLLDGGAHVGCCGLQPRVPAERVCELGYQLNRAFWGHGYAREAAEAVIRHAFTTLGLSGLFAGHHPDNLPSRRVLEGLGFRYTHEEIYPPTGRLEPCYRLDARDHDPFIRT